MSRADESVWKIMAAYAALYAGISFAIDVIGVFTFLVIVIIFSLLVAAIALNENLWFTILGRG